VEKIVLLTCKKKPKKIFKRYFKYVLSSIKTMKHVDTALNINKLRKTTASREAA